MNTTIRRMMNMLQKWELAKPAEKRLYGLDQ